LKIVFFTFYYPPDLCAGSFRSIALVDALSKRINKNNELHIITTHPNRYENYRVKVDDFEAHENIFVHRISVPNHKGGMFSQAFTFLSYARASFKLSKKINPDFLIGTTSRLMTGILTGIVAHRLGCNYFIDLRDIFSESISDIFHKKSKFLSIFFKKTFFFLEQRLLSKASGVNVVSEGFFEYFQSESIDTTNWTFFPNGVDKEFINLNFNHRKSRENTKTILYAGNIGIGQGIDTILPGVAKRIGIKYHFLVIGAGASSSKLINVIKGRNINNVEILSPVKREELFDFYKNADILFLHLNNFPAFKRVLPSKIFEYTVLKKPIVAGLEGYSTKFIQDNIPHAITFKSGDVDGCVDAIKKAECFQKKDIDTYAFIQKYSREKIMKKMAEHIFSLL